MWAKISDRSFVAKDCLVSTSYAEGVFSISELSSISELMIIFSNKKNSTAFHVVYVVFSVKTIDEIFPE